MTVADRERALAVLQRTGYYTFSGYSYSFRYKHADGGRTDNFRDGTTFEGVHSLWVFDNQLRSATFSVLQHVETHLRARLAYTLGEIDPMIHLEPELLHLDKPEDYPGWREKLDKRIAESREDSIVHHHLHRDGVIPVWVAMDVLDWGGLSYLFGFAPLGVRAKVAEVFELSAPQLRSWLRALNIVRNVCAHHSRLFNRYYSLKPKLPKASQHPGVDGIANVADTTFGMLTLAQHMASVTLGSSTRLLPSVLAGFPNQSGLNVHSTGAVERWEANPLWRI